MTRDIGSESEVSDQLVRLRFFWSLAGVCMGGLVGLTASLALGVDGSTGVLPLMLGLLFAGAGWASAREANATRQRLSELATHLDALLARESTEIEPGICLHCGQWLRPEVRFCTSCGTAREGDPHE